ncbi:MAG: GNAT family N-acetyltransferase [Anaerolineae bacterium]
MSLPICRASMRHPKGDCCSRCTGQEAAGCVAFYRLDEQTCELKRLWTRPQFRGKRIGRALVRRLIDEAHGQTTARCCSRPCPC